MSIAKTKEHTDSNKCRKAFLFVITVVVILRIGYIFFREEVDREYYTSAQYDLSSATVIPCEDLAQHFVPSQDRLYSLELCFTDLKADKDSTVVLSLHSDDILLYQTNITLNESDNGIWKRIDVNAEVKPDRTYRLSLHAADDEEGLPSVMCLAGSVAPEIRATYANNELLNKNIAVNFGYLRTPTLFDKAVISSLWLFFLAGAFLILYDADQIKAAAVHWSHEITEQIGNVAFICAAEVLTCAVVIQCSDIVFQPLTRILLYLISVVVSLNWKEKQICFSEVFNTAGKKVGFLILCLYAAFALVGQRCFVYPLDQRVRLEAIAVFLCAAVWFVPVIHSLFWGIENLSRKVFARDRYTPRMQTVQLLFILTLILLLPAVYNLIANNPGISDVDTYESFEKYAQNLYGMYNWHPLFYSLILRQIQKVWNSTYAVILVHYFFWIYVVLELLMYLRQKGMRDSILILFAVLFGFNAANVLHLNTIWKDIPYTLAMLWLLLIISKLSIDQEKYRKKWYIYLELFVSLSLIGLLRKNGIVPLLVTAVPLLVVYRRNLKLIAGILASVVFILYIQGPVYTHYQVIEPGKRGMYVGLGQDILGTYYAGGEVSAETSQMIAVMTKYNTAEYDYNPTWAHQSYDLDIEPTEFVSAYLDTFLKNPVLMSRAMLAREDCLWDIFEGEDAEVGNTNYTDTEDGDRRWNEFYEKRVFRSIAPGMSALTAGTVEVQWMNMLMWRCGFLTMLGLMTVAFWVCRHGFRKDLLIVTPLLGQVLSLLLSTGWTDFRYFWPMNVLNLALIPLLLASCRKTEMKDKDWNSSACKPDFQGRKM